MRLTTVPRLPKIGAGARPWSRLASLVPRQPSTNALRSSSFAAALTIVALAVAFVGALTYFGADEFSGRAADRRAAAEAGSLAELAGRMATADAFNGYIELLRYADDPTVRDRGSTREQRIAAMRQMLYLNTNNMASLTIADRAGTVLASTDPALTSVRGGAAFEATRQTLAPSSSDVVLAPGPASYVEFASPLKDPDGATWAILVGRADPERLWRGTLAASVDGSRTIIINGDGRLAAGVPPELVGATWRGNPLKRGGIAANVGGVDSICGLSTVGAGSQIDQGQVVAACLPASLVEAEHAQATEKQRLITVGGVVLALVAAGAMTWTVFGRRRPLLMLPPPREEARAAPPAAEAPDPGPLRPVVQADVDAVTVIQAYEERSARIAEQLREAVRARLLVASARADEAYRMAADGGGSSAHAEAMDEIERVRDRELRALEQELSPSVLRLGLPTALRSLRKDVAGTIGVTLDIDPLADTVSDDGDRTPIDAGRRIVLYRFAQDTLREFAAAGIRACRLSLHRSDEEIVLALRSESEGEAGGLPEPLLAASRVAVASYAGELRIERADGELGASARFPTGGA